MYINRDERQRAHDLVEVVNWFPERLVFKAHTLLYHSTLGSRVVKKKGKTWWMTLPLRRVLVSVRG